MAWTTPKTWAPNDLVTAALMNVQLRDNLNHLFAALMPTGTTVPYAVASAPSGWLLCDGAAVSRTTYAALYTAIGTTFGVGDGSTTFNVPDLRGRFPLGKDNMGGTSANRVTATQADNLGQGAGAETHTLTTNEMPAHNHPPSSGNFYGLVSGGAGGGTEPQPSSSFTGYSNATTGNTGGGQAHNNMPPYVTLNYIIKT